MKLVDFIESNKSVVLILTVLIAISLIGIVVYGDVVLVSIPITALPFWGVIAVIFIILGFSLHKIKW